MNTISNKQAICETLLEAAQTDKSITVLCSDSRGSGSMTPFADRYPDQFVEVGIAEQDLVSISAGMAKCGKKPFAVSPACFLSTRSYEQIKIDCAYSNMNVKLLGISGGVSYGPLGMSHHSAQDIAAITAIPGMRVYLPSDRLQSKLLTKALLNDTKPAYIRVGRNAVEDVYSNDTIEFEMDKAVVLRNGKDIAIISCGDLVSEAVKAGEKLAEIGIDCMIIDMYCVKPIDRQAVIRAAKTCKRVLTLEEHSVFGGLGAQVCQIIAAECPCKVINKALPDEPVYTGNSRQVFEHYGLDAKGIVNAVKEEITNG